MAERPVQQVDRFQKGKPITADQLNQAVDGINRLALGVRPPVQVRTEAKKAGQAAVEQFMVVSVETDYLVCHTYNGTTEGTDAYKIALPYLLRRTPFDNPSATSGTYSTFTITRNSIGYKYTSDTERVGTNSSNSTETQVIVPSYVDGDVIYAVRGITGGTSVEDDFDEEVTYLDLNVDGRAWAEEA